MKQALEMALEALQHFRDTGTRPSDLAMSEDAITAIKEALAQPEQHTLTSRVNDVRFHKERDEQRAEAMRMLAQPEQEPVVWTEKVGGLGFKEPMPNANYKVIATIAPQRKPLTDEQIDGIASKFYPRSYGLDEFARAIEAAHGIKE